MNKKKFAIIGVAGFVATRHLNAIKETNNHIIAALDPKDSVGILDKYSYDIRFFTEFERFDRYLDKIKRKGKGINYLSICSPNYLHDSHIRYALRMGINAICEKPLVINAKNLDSLIALEKETGTKVYTILQLRLHPSLITIKEKYKNTKNTHEIELTYITPRGNWYDTSWKGDISKSGGITSNIGIHFFDMLIWIFGKVKHYEVHYTDNKKISGYLKLETANVKWFLSTDKNDLPTDNYKPYRNINIDGTNVEFSTGFTDLHTKSYEHILKGEGFGIKDASDSINLVHNIRNTKVIKPKKEHIHPLQIKKINTLK